MVWVAIVEALDLGSCVCQGSRSGPETASIIEHAGFLSFRVLVVLGGSARDFQ